MHIVKVEGLCKRLGKQNILQDVSFTIEEHEIVGFIGPNGAGKSTTMKCLTSLLKPDKGSIKICGYDIQKERKEALRYISAMIESPGLFPNLSGYENLTYFAKIRNISKERMDEMINFTKLGSHIHKKASKYSLGMKQRLGLAIALLHEPTFLILDEPTNGLDPNGIMELRQELRNLVDHHNVSILISSHQLGEIDKIADRIICIHKGVIKETPQIFHQTYAYTFLLDDQNISKAKTLVDATLQASWQSNSVTIYFHEEEGMHMLLKLFIKNDILIKDIIKETVDIEQVYKTIYKEEL